MCCSFSDSSPRQGQQKRGRHHGRPIPARIGCSERAVVARGQSMLTDLLRCKPRRTPGT